MQIENREISSLFRLGARLLELFGENKFKIRSYQNAAYRIERLPGPLMDIASEEITQLDGIGKNIAKKIGQIKETGTYEELERLKTRTPEGIFELLGIKGIGTAKIRIAWEKLGIETPEDMLDACREGKLRSLKGFGEKTETAVKKALDYYFSNRGKFLYSGAEETAMEVAGLIEDAGIVKKVALTGELRRRCTTVNSIDLLVELDAPGELREFLNQCALLENLNGDDPENYRWKTVDKGIPVNIIPSRPQKWIQKLFFTTGAPAFVEKFPGLNNAGLKDEHTLFARASRNYLPPEMRESFWLEREFSKKELENLIKVKDLKGCLHNHSHYSDGKDTLRQMAVHCKHLGYEYFGIADHSRSAFYANGMNETRVEQQWEEVDTLNEELVPFRVFKGIEVDILDDGKLDFEVDFLQKFDFVVASIHSRLNMSKEEATQRLIRAVENPQTTMLGHISGRLLLRREPYPLDYQKVIDACVANEVVIEINANPRRLDIDWRWMNYAVEKGALFSVNPDAHEWQGIEDMRFGVYAARKGGVPTEKVLNTKPLKWVENYFKGKKITTGENSGHKI